MGNKGSLSSHLEPEDATAATQAPHVGASSRLRGSPAAPSAGVDEGDEPPVEVPPPMQPISSVPLATTTVTSSSNEAAAAKKVSCTAIAEPFCAETY